MFQDGDTIVKRTKKTWLSSLFVNAFFWVVGRILKPVPVLGALVEMVSYAI
jgi:hypothetical protein